MGWDPGLSGEGCAVSSPVLLLSRTEVTKNLDPRALVGRLAEGFQMHSLNRSQESRSSHYAPLVERLGGVSASAIGVMEGIPAYSVKVETRQSNGAPSISGFVHLFDSRTGRLLAILESSFVSGVGSALTGALATDLLAPPQAHSLAVVGNGTQGWLGLRFLMEMRSLEEVTLFDLNRRKSLRIAERLTKYKDLKVKVCDSLSEAVGNADVICCATWSREPFLYSEMVKPGAHITTLGADEVGKMEVSPELVRSCSFFCDDRELAVKVGALKGVKGARELVVGELGEILAGQVEGRRSAEETTVYGAVGLPFIDLISSWVAYRRAVKKRIGRTFEPLS